MNMVELSLKDRLQPALLDRLTDDERLLAVVRVTPDPQAMQTHGIPWEAVERVLANHGLRPGSQRAPRGAADGGSGTLEYVAAGRTANLAALRALRVRGTRDGSEVTLQAICQLDLTVALNTQLESGDRRAMSMRRLREAVLRDLGWLLNACGIDDVVDLEPYPEVRRSVINFGLRSQAGRNISSLDPVDVARRIRDAVAFFEPRLSDIRVVPESKEDVSGAMTLSFLVEAELWGQPVAQHLSLRTSIDIETGDVVVGDRGARP
jgi:type VI secretion system protein ImpF